MAVWGGVMSVGGDGLILVKIRRIMAQIDSQSIAVIIDPYQKCLPKTSLPVCTYPAKNLASMTACLSRVASAFERAEWR